MNKAFSLFRRLKLRTVLIVPFVTLVAASALLIGYLSYREGRDSVHQLNARLRRDILARVSERLSNYLQHPVSINAQNSALFQAGVVDPADQVAIARHFRRVIELNPFVNVVYFGNELGGYVGVSRDHVVTLSEGFRAGVLRDFVTDAGGKPVEERPRRDPDAAYNATERPWYRQGVAAGGETWVGPYPYFDGVNVALAAIKPYREHSAAPIAGVLAADFTMEGISQFLTSLSAGESCVTFVLDTAGQLLATSLDGAPESLADNAAVEALGSPRQYPPLVATTVATLRSQHGELTRLGKTVSLEYEFAGETQLAEITPYSVQKQQWLIGVVFPESDFMGSIHKSARLTLALCGLALILAIVVGVMLARRIAKPIADLNEAAGRLARGQWEFSLPIQREDEVGSLAANFRNMAERLRASFAAQQAQIERREQAQLALERSEEDLKITLHSIAEAVVATDAQGLVTRINPRAEELTGFPAADALALPITELLRLQTSSSDERLPLLPAGDGSATSLPVFPENTVLLSKKGTLHQVAGSIAPIRDRSGGVVGQVFVFRDVTDERTLQHQLRQAQKLEAIGQLASGIAHDFNNMLVPIMSCADLIEAETTNNPLVREHANIILGSARRCAALTQQLLTLGRSKERELVPVDVQGCIDRIIALARHSFDKRIVIRTELYAERLSILGEAFELDNVLLNLAINARDAMPDGGTLTFRTSLERIDRSQAKHGAITADLAVRIDVSDDGMGIAPALLDRIFEPFFTTKPLGKGTGLGLASVFSTVKSYGGGVETLSVVGKGTTFSLLLPLASTQGLPQERKPAASIPARASHILLVDDERSVRRAVERMLRQAGHQVTSLEDPQAAIQLYAQRPDAFDVVVSDMMMPTMTGQTLLNRLISHNPQVRFVLCSGNFFSGDLGPGVRDRTIFLQKPFDKQQLAAAIAAALKLSSSGPYG